MSTATDAPKSVTYRSPLADATVPDVRSCVHCGRLLPLSEFRRRWANSERRHSECRSCRQLLENQRLARKRNSARYENVRRKVKAIRRLKERRQVEGLGRALVATFGTGEKMAAELCFAAEWARDHGYPDSALSLLQCYWDVQIHAATALSKIIGDPDSVALLSEAGQMPAVLRGLIEQGRLTAEAVQQWANAVAD